MYKRSKITDPDSEMHIILEKHLQDYNSILQRNINEAKKMYYNTKSHLYVNDIMKTWLTIN